MTRRFYHLFTLMLIVAQPSLADDKAPVKISYRITSLVPLQGKSYANSINGTRFEVSKLHVSNPIKAVLREGLFLDFFEESAKPKTPPAFSIKIPNGALGRDLLVIIRSIEGKTKYLLQDLKALRIPGGGQYVHNLLPMPIAVQCGKGVKPIIIPSRQQKVVPAPNGDKVIQSFYTKPQKGPYKKFSSNLYFKDKETRYIVFCYQKEGGKFPKLAQIAIYNRPPVKEKP